ncbi:MAG: ABC transporter ATP-binding protein, partial [Gammaproteobacteria bacterium]
GEVWLEGIYLESLSNAELSEIRKPSIGFVFQSYNLIPVMTAYENAAFVLDLQGVDKSERHDRVMQILADVGLVGLEHRRPDEMSGGQQQRVAIARAIVTQPAIVLADEPTANVDSHTAEALLDLMQNLNQQQNITFLFSTHDQHVIDRAKRIIQVQDGQISSDEYRV